MYGKKIIKILETFEEKEWKACHKYLRYCNKKDAKGLLLFEYIFKYRHDLSSPKLSDEQVKRKVIKGLNDRAFLNLISDLVKDIEAFMVHHYMNSPEGKYEHKYLLTKIFKNKGLYTYFERIWKEVNTELESTPKISLFHNLRKLEMNHTMYFSDISEKNTKPVRFLVEAEKNRIQFSKDLGAFYKTEFANLKAIKNINESLSKESDKTILSELIENLNTLISTNSQKSFDHLVDSLFTKKNEISKDLKKAIIIRLINYCIENIRRGDQSKKGIMAELTIFGLQEGIYFQNNRLTENTFLNIIDSLSNSNIEINHVEFINQWINKVNSEDHISVKNMALAMWLFAKDQYGKALEVLSSQEMHLNRPNLSLRARWITLCSLCSSQEEYLEKNEILRSSISFFNRSKSKMNNSTYQASLNLVSIVKVIWEGANSVQVENKISECEFLVMRTWIDKMVNRKTQEENI